MYLLLPYVIFFIALFALVNILNVYNQHLEYKRKAKFKALAQRKVFIGTPEQLERLREWDAQRN